MIAMRTATRRDARFWKRGQVSQPGRGLGTILIVVASRTDCMRRGLRACVRIDDKPNCPSIDSSHHRYFCVATLTSSQRESSCLGRKKGSSHRARQSPRPIHTQHESNVQELVEMHESWDLSLFRFTMRCNSFLVCGLTKY